MWTSSQFTWTQHICVQLSHLLLPTYCFLFFRIIRPAATSNLFHTPCFISVRPRLCDCMAAFAVADAFNVLYGTPGFFHPSFDRNCTFGLVALSTLAGGICFLPFSDSDGFFRLLRLCVYHGFPASLSAVSPSITVVLSSLSSLVGLVGNSVALSACTQCCTSLGPRFLCHLSNILLCSPR